MNRILLIIIMCLVGTTASAQYANINYDAKTVAAMAAAYGAETASEAYYNEQVKKILEKYTSAEVAAAAIFSSKFLDRKALTDLGIWSSPTENYYYKRIYRMVSAKIIPKILVVARMMLEQPQNALYWGSYLMKICDETKALCMQFESVVTNSRLGFSDIDFLELCPEVRQLFEFAQYNIVNWDNMQKMLSEAPEHFTKENLKADAENLYNIAVGIASSAAQDIMNDILRGSDFSGLMQGKITGIYDAVVSCERIYGNINNLTAGKILDIVGSPENVHRLFNISDYNIAGWVTDYVDRADGQYYTQRWYIYRRESGSEVVCNYNPPTDNNSILYGSPWYRVNTTDPNYYPPAAVVEAALSNSERHAGWSRAKVDQLNRQDDSYRYSMNYHRNGYILNRGGKQYGKAYAYSISVTKSWNWTEEVYEDVFDSYNMDLATFQKQMQAKLASYNDNEEGTVYQLGYDGRNYYTASDAGKLKGTESVIVSVTCHDGAKLMNGTTQYKCKSCGASVSNHTKDCVMKSTLTGNEGNDTSELDRLETEYRNTITLLQSQIRQLENTNAELVRQIASASVEEAAVLRQKYNANQNEINRLKGELTTAQGKLKEVLQAKEEASQDNDIQTDDYYRIPAIMHDCRTAYSLTWNSDGHWSGNTYIRTATTPNINGTITFKATISIARKPKYFLGIKIHRAIVQIDYELTAEYSDTQVVEIINLDPGKSEAEKQKQVNDRISAIARDYPNCQIDTQYVRNNPAETDDTEDTYHLLWSSDRLEIARGVDMRLHKIYADLVSIEKMMNYKRSIIDVLLSIAPPVNDEQGRRQTLIQQARRRWLRNAANAHHSDMYNGKYDDDIDE